MLTPAIINELAHRLQDLRWRSTPEWWGPNGEDCPPQVIDWLAWIHQHEIPQFPPTVDARHLLAGFHRQPKRLWGASLTDLQRLLGFLVAKERMSPGAMADFIPSGNCEIMVHRLRQVAEAAGKPPVEDRQRGCLLGLFVGDALGAQVEFKGPKGVAEAFPGGVRTMQPGGPHHLAAGQITDDGELAIALMDATDPWGWYDADQAAQGYSDWLASGPFDIGGTIAAAITGGDEARQRIQAERAARKAGLPVPEQGTVLYQPSSKAGMADALRAAANPNSQANGALMRLGGLVARGFRGPVIAHAAADASLTHPNPVCVDANRIMAAALQVAILGTGEPQDIWAAAWNAARAPDDDDDRPRIPGQPAPLTSPLSLQEAIQTTIYQSSLSAPERCHGEGAGWVLKALQLAFYHLYRATPYEEALVDVIARGGDTDTNAAITGMLLGAAYGEQAIPQAWRDSVLACRPDDDSPQPRPERWWAAKAMERLGRVPDRG